MATQSKSQSKPATAAAELVANHEATLADLDPRPRAQLAKWMEDYVTTKAEIDERELKLESLKLDKIEPLRLRLGLTKIDAEGWYIARRPGRSALDKAKLKINLVNSGVPVKIVTGAMDAATSTGKPFTEIKRKKSEKE